MQYIFKNGCLVKFGFLFGASLFLSNCTTMSNAPTAFTNAQDEMDRAEEIGTEKYFPNAVETGLVKYDSASRLYRESLREGKDEEKTSKLTEASAMAEESSTILRNANSLASNIPAWDADINSAATEIGESKEIAGIRQKISELEAENAQMKQQLADSEALKTEGFARAKDFRFNGSVAFFSSSSSSVEPNDLKRIEDIADSLRQSPSLRARVSAFTDTKGSPSANESLKVARAESVKSVLVSKGVSESQIEINTQTEAIPAATHPGKQQLQRRVDIEVMPIQ
jgi:outer membrane protein OmpA-like peptidoglycan-associated protein